MTDVTVTHAPDRHRFEARLDGRLAGFADYQQTPELWVFTHTEVDPAFEGRGVGGALVRGALDHVREDGTRTVLAICPFVRAWIERNPGYADLLYRARPSTVDD
ncbi:MAG: GNAT family N-acetyltransferase [Acidobacteria bacterium]|nr:MAG: GNAT family N-acetyltransferase [Acidobacteriota bacterium]